MALQVVPDPQGMAWQDWCDTVVGFNDACRNQVSPDSSWEEFAERLTLIEPTTPRPDFFESWQAWAAALKRTIQI